MRRKGFAACAVLGVLAFAHDASAETDRGAKWVVELDGDACKEHASTFEREVTLACQAVGGTCQVVSSPEAAELRAKVRCTAAEVPWTLEVQTVEGALVSRTELTVPPSDRLREAAIEVARDQAPERVLAAETLRHTLAPAAATDEARAASSAGSAHTATQREAREIDANAQHVGQLVMMKTRDAFALASRPAGPPLLASASAPTARGEASASVVDEHDILVRARNRALAGDVASRRKLERLARSSDAHVSRRASFTLAELELPSASKEKARARLAELMLSPDPPLAIDAATLLARTQPSPSARAEVWRKYLATTPPHPYFERALLERADALLDTGRSAEARTVLEEVRRTRALDQGEQRQLDRLAVKARDAR